MNKPALDALFAAVFAAILGVILAPLWNDFWADMKPAMGAPLVALIGIMILIGIAAFGLAILHYFGVLGGGAEPIGRRERNDYDALLQRIAAGNWIAREYARRLNSFLNAIDRFFGDEGMADRTLFPHAFGLQIPAPLWTVPAFDRCLLLALVYPVGAIVLIWAISNHVGPAEGALGLEETDNWRRATALVAIIIVTLSIWRCIRSKGPYGVAWMLAASVTFIAMEYAGVVRIDSVVIFAIAIAVTGMTVWTFPGASNFISVVSITGVIVFAFAFALVIAIFIGMTVLTTFDINGTVASLLTFLVAYAFSIAVAVVIGVVQKRSENRGWQGSFLFVFVFIMVLVCLTDAAFLSHFRVWKGLGPLLLFLGLLTLLNAPFDWLSLGFTRALMRRGLEREKWWPYLYAVIDALLASGVIVFLAMAMVAGVRLFDGLAVYGGGERALPPMREFLDAIRADPGKPEYWWVYATLFSTMLPSLINLFIAGVSLARGVPGVSSWLMGKVREGEAVPAYDRLLVAIVLALQGVAAVAFAILAQGFFFWVIIWQGMPRLGMGVLDLAYLVAH